jgi:hypothetical protein
MVRKVVVAFVLFLVAACNEATIRKSADATTVSCAAGIDERMRCLSENFTPTNLSFDASISQDSALTTFLRTTSPICIKSQQNYKGFIYVLFLKQYLQHLRNYHQGYDLLEMRQGQAGFLIDCLRELCVLDSGKLEMLNSGYAISCISESDKSLYPQIDTLITQIDNQSKDNEKIVKN